MRQQPPKGPKRPGRPKTVVDGEQISLRLDAATLLEVDKVIEAAGFGTRAQVLREAVGLGIQLIKRRYDL